MGEREFFESEKCVLEGCDFVGKTSYALETHIRSFHEEQLDYRNDSIASIQYGLCHIG